MTGLIALALTVALHGAAQSRPATGTASITGRVTVETGTDRVPVRRARVMLESTALPKPLEADSDTNGTFTFDGLPAGTYRIRAEKAGFVPAVDDPRRAFDPPSPVELADAQALAVHLPMVRGAAMEGRVTSPSGTPLINVVVSAVRIVWDENGRRPTPVRQARTDDRGHFRVHTLPRGDYYLEAAADPMSALQQPNVAGQQATLLERTYYPGAPTVEGGRTIALSIGENVTDLHLAVPTVVAATLRGRVIDAAGRQAPASGIRLRRVDGQPSEASGAWSPDWTTFQFPRVPPGDYWLIGATRRDATSPVEYGVSRLTVFGQDLPDLVVSTAPGTAIHGRIEVESGTLPTGHRLTVVPHSTAFALPLVQGQTGAPIRPADVAGDGSFTFDGLFGPTLLRVDGLPPGWALRSVTIDGTDVTDAAMDFRGAPAPVQARIVVTAATGSVTGVAHDAEGRPAERARIVVFVDDERAWGWRSRQVHSVETDAGGRFTLDGILAGRYRAVAVPFLDDRSWMDATLLERLKPLATEVVVDGAGRVTIALGVQAW